MAVWGFPLKKTGHDTSSLNNEWTLASFQSGSICQIKSEDYFWNEHWSKEVDFYYSLITFS